MPDDSMPPAEGDYTESGVPNFDYVRDRIENRFATAPKSCNGPPTTAPTSNGS